MANLLYWLRVTAPKGSTESYHLVNRHGTSQGVTLHHFDTWEGMVRGQTQVQGNDKDLVAMQLLSKWQLKAMNKPSEVMELASGRVSVA
jgi:hypothetical protein